MDQLLDDMIGLKQGHWFSFEKIVGKCVGGQIFRETFYGLKGWKKRFFFLDRRAIPDAMAWRHHDSNISDPVLEDGFSEQYVQTLAERVIDVRPVPSGLLFQGGLATTWDFPGFLVTMSEYLCFSFQSGATIEKGSSLTNQDQRAQHTVPPLSLGQAIPDKTGHQKEVEVEDPKIVATRERKARAAAKKKEKKKQGGDGGEGSHPKTKRRKNVNHKDGPAASEATSSPELIRTLNPTQPSGANTEAGESSSGSVFYVSEWSIHRICRVDTPMWCRELMVHLTDIFKRFENLQADFGRLAESHTKCGDMAEKLVQARLDLAHSSHLYTSLSDRYKAFKNDHEGCAGKLKGLENHNRELSQANKDQALRIKELEDTLAKKDSALVYAERINFERAQEKEKLVSQLGRVEMENFDCIRKLLPTVVGRLLQSHEYKQSLFEPFNLAIQAGWGKGLAEERSNKDLLKLMGRMEGFDAYADMKIKVEYEKLFEKRHPYVEKISHGFRHSVFDLLKVYPDSPPHGQAPPSKPSSEKAPSTSAPREP
nr:hypothetical protein [Tanacetum cinerariifolium]